MQNRSVLDSPRLLELKKKKQKILIRKIIIFVVLFLALITGLTFLSRIKKLNISDIKVTGNTVIDSEQIKTSVENQISGKYLWLFPKSNIFLYPKSKVKRELGNQFKRLTDINLSLDRSRNLNISVTERSPEYTWCGVAITDTPEKETCYFLDKSGYIFDVAPYFSGEVYFKFYGATTPTEYPANGASSPAGTYVAQGYFDKLVAFKNSLGDIGLKPVILYIQDSGDIKVYLSRSKASPVGPQILFKKDADFDRVAENLKAAITTEPLKSKFKNYYSTLQYIDLRFGNKVYYKFTTSAPMPTAAVPAKP